MTLYIRISISIRIRTNALNHRLTSPQRTVHHSTAISIFVPCVSLLVGIFCFLNGCCYEKKKEKEKIKRENGRKPEASLRFTHTHTHR